MKITHEQIWSCSEERASEWSQNNADFKLLCRECFHHIRHHVHESHCTGEFAKVVWRQDSFTVSFRGDVRGESGLKELASVNPKTSQWTRIWFTKTVMPACFEKMKFSNILTPVSILLFLKATMCFPYWWCTKHAKWIKYGQVIPCATLVQTWLPNSCWTPLLILILTRVHWMISTVMRLTDKDLATLCWTHDLMKLHIIQSYYFAVSSPFPLLTTNQNGKNFVLNKISPRDFYFFAFLFNLYLYGSLEWYEKKQSTKKYHSVRSVLVNE